MYSWFHIPLLNQPSKQIKIMGKNLIFFWAILLLSAPLLKASWLSSIDTISPLNYSEEYINVQELENSLFPDSKLDLVTAALTEKIITSFITGNAEEALNYLTPSSLKQTNFSPNIICQLKNIECALLLSKGDLSKASKKIDELAYYADLHNIPCGKSYSLIQLARLYFLTGEEETAHNILNLSLNLSYINRCQQVRTDIYLLKAQFYFLSHKKRLSNINLTRAKNVITYANQSDALFRYLLLYSTLDTGLDTLITSTFENDLFVLQQKSKSIHLKTLIANHIINKSIQSGHISNAKSLIQQQLLNSEYSDAKNSLLKIQILFPLIQCLIYENKLDKVNPIIQQIESTLENLPRNTFNAELFKLKKTLAIKLNDLDALISLQEKENESQYSLSEKISGQILLEGSRFLNASAIKAKQQIDRESRKTNNLIILSIVVLIVLIVIGFIFSQYRTERNSNTRHIELKQELLISQLGPKFSYRWISGLKDMLKDREPDEAADYLSIFAKFTRTILHAPQNDFIPLQQEIESLKRYFWLLQQNTLIPINLNLSLPEDQSIFESSVPPFFSHVLTEVILGSLLNKNREIIVSLNVYEKGRDVFLDYTIQTKDKSEASLDQETRQELHKAERLTHERISLLKKLHKRDLHISISDKLNHNGQYNVLFRIAKLEKEHRRFRFLL